MLTILFYTLVNPGYFAELSIERRLCIFSHLKYKLILISIPALCHMEVLKGKVERNKGPYAAKSETALTLCSVVPLSTWTATQNRKIINAIMSAQG